MIPFNYKTNRQERCIILVANTTWYLYNFRLPLIEELVTRQYRVIALSPNDKYVAKLQKYKVTHVNIKISRSGINPFKDMLLVNKFRSIYNKYKPDIVQHFTIKPVIYGTWAAKAAKVKHIFNMIPGLGYVFTGRNLKKAIVRKVVKNMYRRALALSEHIYFQNSDDRDYFLDNNLVDVTKTSIVPGTGVNTEFFCSNNKKSIKKKITFILFARMLWDKGIKEFVEAAYELRTTCSNTNFWLVGPIDQENPKGIRHEQLENWNNEGVIQYHGMTDNIRDYLKKADVVVLPSYYREGIPLSLLEAASMAMPIITTDSVGCREVVENGKNGFLIPIKDSKRLAYEMKKFIINSSLITKMGKESRRIAMKKFDSRDVVQQIVKFYPSI